LWARRDGRLSARFRRELDRRQFDSANVIRARQAAALRRMLRHAAATVPHYRQLFGQLGLDPSEITEVSDLAALPILTKFDIRRLGSALRSETFRDSDLTRKKTSGSTGVPLEIKLDPAGLEWKRACTLRSDEWSGWRRGERTAKVWGNPEYRQFGWRGRLRNGLYERSIHLDTLQMSNDTIDRFARQLARIKPSLIFGHAHS